uniref:Uncharacterized protein n=1 Tax=Solanum lycopersicum TaxID=4081 RepID=A0A3Q7FQX8_SOLLC
MAASDGIHCGKHAQSKKVLHHNCYRLCPSRQNYVVWQVSESDRYICQFICARISFKRSVGWKCDALKLIDFNEQLLLLTAKNLLRNGIVNLDKLGNKCRTPLKNKTIAVSFALNEPQILHI